MKQRLGGIYAFQHHRPEDLDFHRDLNAPAWGAHDPDIEQLLNYHEATPDALCLPRKWSWDDDKGKAYLRCQDDPEGYGISMASRWDTQLYNWHDAATRRGRRFPEREQMYVSLFCEPPIWKHELRDGLVRAEIAFIKRMVELNRPVAACRWAVGHPAEQVAGDGSPPDYSPYEDILNLVVRYQDQIILCLDEYWYPDLGPQEGFGWYFGRHQYVDSAITRIGLTEIGCDALVLKDRFKNQPGERGWRGRVSPERYADDIGWAVVHAQPRVEFALGFIIDHGGWKSFDLHDAYPQILTVAQNIRDMPELEEEEKVYVPTVVMDGPQIVTGDDAFGNDVIPVLDGNGYWTDGDEIDESEVEVSYGALDPYMLQAILQVESNGFPFDDDGRPTIRFEAHIFKKIVDDDVVFDKFFKLEYPEPYRKPQWYKDATGDWAPIHTGNQRTEYRALELAKMMWPESAYESIGMGVGQTMGFNAQRLGYPSAQAMWLAYHDETAQIIGAINYILSDGDLVEAVRAKDWRTIAYLYNGPGAVDEYAPKLEAAYEFV